MHDLSLLHPRANYTIAVIQRYVIQLMSVYNTSLISMSAFENAYLFVFNFKN